MKKTLYYVVEKQTQCVSDFDQELNGLKYITVYSIQENKPIKEFLIEVDNSDCSEQAIQAYLEDNRVDDDDLEDNEIDDDEFELVQL